MKLMNAVQLTISSNFFLRFRMNKMKRYAPSEKSTNIISTLMWSQQNPAGNFCMYLALHLQKAEYGDSACSTILISLKVNEVTHQGQRLKCERKSRFAAAFL
jgi:hypothetical protein